MFKRLIDLFVSGFGLLAFAPLLLVVMFLVWYQDRHSPFYIAPRVGRNGKIFSMVKMRSMIIGADSRGSSSTSNTDSRITPIGKFIRSYKIDEITQLWNVFIGDMSLVGPRPQVQSGVDLYTDCERQLLSVKPGITDFASIVFADEGTILAGYTNPDSAYNELIRPGKSALGLFYIENRSVYVDILLLLFTLLTLVSRQKALARVQLLLRNLGADSALIELAGRTTPLMPSVQMGMILNKMVDGISISD